MNVREAQVSTEIKQYVQEFLRSDPNAKKIAEIEEKIQERHKEIVTLEADLSILQKTRPEVNIEYRKSIIWCLTIDAQNPYYFLKSKEGLVKCAEFKHKVKLTPKQNNAFGAILSGMFRDKLVGRIVHFDMYFYGLPVFFDKDKDGFLTILKKKHENKLPDIRQVSI